MEVKTVTEKPWTGRFTESTDAFVEAFTASVTFDQRMAHYDIRGSVAHARMLADVGVLTSEEQQQIVAGLERFWRRSRTAISIGRLRWKMCT